MVTVRGNQSWRNISPISVLPWEDLCTGPVGPWCNHSWSYELHKPSFDWVKSIKMNWIGCWQFVAAVCSLCLGVLGPMRFRFQNLTCVRGCRVHRTSRLHNGPVQTLSANDERATPLSNHISKQNKNWTKNRNTWGLEPQPLPLSFLSFSSQPLTATYMPPGVGGQGFILGGLQPQPLPPFLPCKIKGTTPPAGSVTPCRRRVFGSPTTRSNKKQITPWWGLGPQPLPLEPPGFGTAVPPLLPRKKIKNNKNINIYPPL